MPGSATGNECRLWRSHAMCLRGTLTVSAYITHKHSPSFLARLLICPQHLGWVCQCLVFTY